MFSGLVLRISITLFICSECYGALISVPVSQTAFVGQKVVFQCATNLSCALYWNFMATSGSQYTIYNEHGSKEGYSVDHPTPENCTLIIDHTSSGNAGSFLCLEVCSWVWSAPAPLTVFDVESATNTTSQLATGDVVLVSCKILFYCPTYPAYSNVSVTIYDQAENAVAKQSYQFTADNKLSCNTNQILSTNVTVTGSTVGPFDCEVRCLDSMPVVSKRITVLQLHQVFYAVGAVDVSPSSGELSAGDVVNCSASGYPEPSYFWELNVNQTWERIHDGSVLRLVTPGTYILRCTAYNTVRNIPYSNTSRDAEFHISERTDQTTISSSAKPNNKSSANVGVGSTDSSNFKVKVGVGVGVGVGGLLLLLLIVVLVCLRRKLRKPKHTKVHNNNGSARSNIAFQSEDTNRLSTTDDVTLVENCLYGEAPMANGKAQMADGVKKHNNGQTNVQTNQDANLYADIRKSTFEPAVNGSAHSDGSKSPAKKNQLTVQSNDINSSQTISNSSTSVAVGGSSLQDLTLIDNSIYKSMTAIPAGPTNNGPEFEYATLDETKIRQ